VYEDVSINEIVGSSVDDKPSDSSMCQYVRDLYSLCLEATTFLKMIVDKENNLVDEYAKQVNTILSTIRKRSIGVIEGCTYNGCRDILKVSYYIYVVLNPKHSDHFKPNQAPIFMSMIMSILNIYGIDHCGSPKFNFLLLNSTYLEDIGNDDVLNKRLNSFVQSLETYQNVSIVEKYSTFLNIDNFFKTYLEKTDLFTKNKHMISFFYKGERKYIDEIYKNISAIIMDPSHVFKLYDIYFKFILGSVFHKVWVFVNYSTIAVQPKSNLLRSNDCDDFLEESKKLLNIEHFPSNLSILVSYVDRFSTMVYDLCYQRATITENYKAHDKSKGEIPHFKVFGREGDRDNLYLEVGKLKENAEKQFEKFGMFITKIIKEIPETTKDHFDEIFLKKTNLVEKVFEDTTENTVKLVKGANNMLTNLIINTYLMEGNRC